MSECTEPDSHSWPQGGNKDSSLCLCVTVYSNPSMFLYLYYWIWCEYILENKGFLLTQHCIRPVMSPFVQQWILQVLELLVSVYFFSVKCRDGDYMNTMWDEKLHGGKPWRGRKGAQLWSWLSWFQGLKYFQMNLFFKLDYRGTRRKGQMYTRTNLLINRHWCPIMSQVDILNHQFHTEP